MSCLRAGGVLGYDGRPDYWDSKQTTDPYWAKAKREYFLSALAMLPQGRLLDLGGGVGEFASVAIDAGRDAYSYDTSPDATAAARERIGSHALEEAVSGFDVVTLWCVIAHVPEPGALLDSVQAALRAARSGSRLRTSRSSAATRGCSRLPAGRCVFGPGDDHLWHFTADSLRRLLEAHGFRDVRFHYRGVIESVRGPAVVVEGAHRRQARLEHGRPCGVQARPAARDERTAGHGSSCGLAMRKASPGGRSRG